MANRLIVIMDDDGSVVATQLAPTETNDSTPHGAGIAAGPGQKLHTIDFDVPELKSPEDIEKFHKAVGDALRD